MSLHLYSRKLRSLPKGIKQKLTVNDCLFQKKYKDEEDPVNNTLKDLEHFQKFKEYLEKDKILDFKNEEHNCKKNLFLILKLLLL